MMFMPIKFISINIIAAINCIAWPTPLIPQHFFTKAAPFLQLVWLFIKYVAAFATIS